MQRKTNPIIGATNRAIRNAQTEARAAYDRVKHLKTNRMAMRRLAPITAGLTANEVDLYGGYSSNSLVQLYITLFDLDGFKDERLTKVLAAVYEMTPEIHESEIAQYHEKVYTARVGNINIRVAAHVKEDSETCKRVEVGRELVEQVKYKMICS